MQSRMMISSRNGHHPPNGKQERALPADVEAEKKLLACCMLGHRPADLPGITPASFIDPSHVKLFAHLQIYFVRHTEYDGHLFLSQLDTAGDLEAVGGATYLGNVLAAEWSPVHVAHYAEIVADRAARRRLILAADGAYDLGRPLADVITSATPPPPPAAIRGYWADELLDEFPTLREPVIDGIARRGEVVNIIAASKFGKSWLTYTLLMSIATGQPWLGTFPCVKGKAILFDNELHKETLAGRLATIANAMGLDDSWRKSIKIFALRGEGLNFRTLDATIGRIAAGEFQLVVCDAYYRFLPDGFDENANSPTKDVYNLIDRHTEKLQAVWMNVHHESKGDQSGKKVTDVGAGAGSQSRAADAHLVLRQHEEERVAVVDAALRSFAPIEPFSIRWEYPLWSREDSADPSRLKRPATASEMRQQSRDAEGRAAIVAALAGGAKKTRRSLWGTGLSDDRLKRLLAIMEGDGEVISEPAKVGGNKTEIYSLSPIDRGVFE